MAESTIKRRFFKRRNPKVELKTQKTQIIIPVRPISILLIIILTVVSIFFALRSDIFLIHSVDVKGIKENTCMSSQQAKESLQFIGRSIIFLNLSRSIESLKVKFTCVKDVLVEKKWPDKIIADIKYRQPLSVLAIEKKEAVDRQDANSQFTDQATNSAVIDYHYFVIDEEGFVYQKVATVSSNLPLIYSRSTIIPQIGAKIEIKPVKVTAEIIKRLADLQISVANSFINADLIEINLIDEVMVIFTADKDASLQTSSLQAIIRQSKIDGKQLTKVDLRFDKPIVNFR